MTDALLLARVGLGEAVLLVLVVAVAVGLGVLTLRGRTDDPG